MRTAILIHGRPDKEEYYDPKYPSPSNSHWLPWLTKQLMVNNIFTVAPEIPQPWQPRYDIWKKELERFDITPETILVGHSCGGGFIVRWLSENKDKRVDKVVLVAPWLNPENNPVSDTADFFNFQIDENLAERTKGVTIFNSDNDMETIQKSVKILRDKIKGNNYKEFQNCGHFCFNDLKTDEFPELLDEILKK
jgi:predicted alpha/beta hydrolase family esterase